MTDHSSPCYFDLFASGELATRVAIAKSRLGDCDLCARCCHVNRLKNSDRAGCRTGALPYVASYGPHFGEEAPLRGIFGSGTIFFSRCNLSCVYCQNHDISQQNAGRVVTPDELAAMMIELQGSGCHNINLVSPSHVVAQILEAVSLAIPMGLRIPLVYNTGGYDAVDTLELLEGVVDIYMPDMKYADQRVGKWLSGIPRYPQVNQDAVREMHRQVGDLMLDENGIAQKGVLVRHLVLPENLAGTNEIAQFLSRQISRDTYLNVMDQYRPCYQVGRKAQFEQLNRPITSSEFQQAMTQAQNAGLYRFDR